MSLSDALEAEQREQITFVQGLKWATHQRLGVQVITADRNAIGETGMVHTERH
jgi:hypothetical protein